MATNDGAVDHVLPVVGQSEIDQGGEHRVPHALLGPAPEADIDRVPLAIALVHVAPRATNPQDVEHPVQKPSVVVRRPSLATPLSGQQSADHRPLVVR